MDERTENLRMWRELGLDVDRHCDLLNLLRSVYPDIYMSQANRPPAISYFDSVVAEIHGDRVRELLESKQEGSKVIGTFCVYVPDELIHAADAIPVGLCGGAAFSIPDAEAVLPRNLCPLIKSFVGFKLSKLCPYFESCDLLVGETTCDGKKKTWEIMADDMPVHVMELPHRKGEMERELWLSEIRTLKSRLEELTGNMITSENLAAGIRSANDKRRALARLHGLRKTSPPPISGKDALLVSQIAFYDDARRFASMANVLADQCEQRVADGTAVVSADAPRLLVSGCPMAIPNWKLHHVVESAGAVVVGEETCTGTRYFENLVDESHTTLEGQLAAIADRYLKTNCACFTPNDDRIQQIIQHARATDAKGVIHYSLQFCHTYNVESVRVEKALRAAGIPMLKVEDDYGMEDIGQLHTRVEAFMEQIA